MTLWYETGGNSADGPIVTKSVEEKLSQPIGIRAQGMK